MAALSLHLHPLMAAFQQTRHLAKPESDDSATVKAESEQSMSIPVESESAGTATPLLTQAVQSRHRDPDDVVDEASVESFPASDPPAWTPVLGERATQFANADLIRDLLPTLDNLRHALENLPKQWSLTANEASRDWLSGTAMIEQVLLEALEKHGVSRIVPALGEEFNPHRHEAIFEVSNSMHPAGTVVEVLRPGYALHDRLLRAALVGVAGGQSSIDDCCGEPTAPAGR